MRWAALLVLASCVWADRYRHARAPDAAKITVLVPGYQGSFLYRGEELVWNTPGQSFSSGSFSLGTCEDGQLPLEPGGPISGFTVFPVNLDVYGGFMDWGAENLAAFVGFGYDWRLSQFEAAQQLCDFIGPRKADVIAHSMGGLVTWLALQKCAEKIDHVV